MTSHPGAQIDGHWALAKTWMYGSGLREGVLGTINIEIVVFD